MLLCEKPAASQNVSVGNHQATDRQLDMSRETNVYDCHINITNNKLLKSKDLQFACTVMLQCHIDVACSGNGITN